MVIAQEPTQSLAALHRPLAVDVCIAREQQDVVLPLMIALSVVMLDVFAQCAPQGALAEEDQLGQAVWSKYWSGASPATHAISRW